MSAMVPSRRLLPSSTLSWYTSLSSAAPTQLPSSLKSWHYTVPCILFVPSLVWLTDHVADPAPWVSRRQKAPRARLTTCLVRVSALSAWRSNTCWSCGRQRFTFSKGTRMRSATRNSKAASWRYSQRHWENVWVWWSGNFPRYWLSPLDVEVECHSKYGTIRVLYLNQYWTNVAPCCQYRTNMDLSWIPLLNVEI